MVSPISKHPTDVNRRRHRFILSWLTLLLVLLLSACNTTPPGKGDINNNDGDIPDDFDYDTTRQVTFNISTQDLLGKPIATTVFEVYHSFNLTAADPTDGTLVLTGITDAQGKYSGVVDVPSYIKTVLVNLSYVGLPSSAEVEIGTDNSVDVRFAPVSASNLQAGVSFDVGTPDSSVQNLSTQAATYTYLGTYTNQGVPNYLAPSNPPSARILKMINTSLTERKAVTIHHPNFIVDGSEANLILKTTGEVSVTFLHEGTGYKNGLGYYYYNKNQPPASRDAINNLTIIFPNSSYLGSGGGLRSGDQVKLKYKPGTTQESTTFPAGTVVGWFLVAHGWDNNGVGNGYNLHVSNSNLNAEKTSELKKHTVLLYDEIDQMLILGIEDINREKKYADHDFNDAMFQVSVSPITSLDLTGVAVADTGEPKDTDADGISDLFDNYPTDASKAFNNYFPAKDAYGTLAYEDQWPLKGDYDFNDLVVDYRINQITNAQNKVVELKATYLFRAAGASFTNAFAFELPIAPEKVASVSGQWFAGSTDHAYNPESPWIYLDLNENGTEKLQDKAVIFVADDTAAFLGRLINTEPEGQVTAPKIREVTVTFTEPLSAKDLGKAPYNPFIVTDIYHELETQCDCQKRGTEVHLPHNAPTSLADTSLFNTGDDTSSADLGTTYKTADNLPWALHIPSQFDYPIENSHISLGHINFSTWASSGGATTQDWYLDKKGYRDSATLYDQSKLPPAVVVK
jgi:LruC domain-containing protein